MPFVEILRSLVIRPLLARHSDHSLLIQLQLMTWRISVPDLEDSPEWLGVPEEGGPSLELGAQLPGVTGGQGQPAGKLHSTIQCVFQFTLHFSLHCSLHYSLH